MINLLLMKVNTIYTHLTVLSQSSPIVAGAISLWGLGVITFIFRNVPQIIFNFLKHQCTTTLTINNADASFYDFLQLVNDHRVNFMVRSFNLNDGHRFSADKQPKLTIGYGRTLFFFAGKLMILQREQINTSNTSIESKEMITITSFGRSNKAFLKVFNEVQRLQQIDKDHIYVCTWNYNTWVRSFKIPKRSMDTIVIPNETKKILLSSIEDVMQNKEWYVKNGTPWRIGVLLKGPPGTGKTSLIKGL